MPVLPRGLYEVLVTEALDASLREVDHRLSVSRTSLRAADAADRVALHLGRVIRRAIDDVDDEERVAFGIDVARRVIELLEVELRTETLAAPGSVLRAIEGRLPDGSPEQIPEPLTPLLDTTLLTNAPGEPRIASQLVTEIDSADRIDLVMAFIRRSGLKPLLAALKRHTGRSAPLRVLTTTYTASTEVEALDELRDAGAELRVSYDTTSTRLHAKAWLFHRASGFSTAYIGSSNLTHSAQVTGLEWNVRLSGARNPDVIAKVNAVFEAYWNGGDFVPYRRDEFVERTKVEDKGGPRTLLSPLEVHPLPFQERLLERIALSRQSGFHRNLLVSATGTGKTVMAAIDYARLRESMPRARLLFVAHRREILEQSLATFRHCIREASFGELWVGGNKPSQFDHVFASIQSLTASGLEHLAPDHFDIVIVDEFHHAAAASYERLLDRVRPVELLGLTATPERSDGLPILERFDDRIAAELRLWDAIDQHRLSPFSYYGISDGLDLRDVPWKKGRGYEVEGLTNLLTANDAWARRVIRELERHVDDLDEIRALGFCVSVDHARFMARVFGEAGITCRAIWADTPENERRAALDDLDERRINVLFSVDLFNEGVDLPVVDTLLFLRPTDSPVLFLQQLGRGLRRSEGKVGCTVLDFVGQHRREFRFDRRFGALLGLSRKQITAQIEAGFPFLPAGCHMELDHVAQEIVLRSIRESVPSAWTEKRDELTRIAKGRTGVALPEFLSESGLEVEDVYNGDRSWSDLLAAAGLAVLPAGPHEAVARRGVGRLLHLDDRLRIQAYRRFLELDAPPALGVLAADERRLLRMLVASVLGQILGKATRLDEAATMLWQHPQVKAELLELLGVLVTRISHVPHRLTQRPEVPLTIHARYSRVEILAAFGIGKVAKVAPWQSGVYWAEDARADVLAFTLDKTSGHFSPTTRYRDYAISPVLIHWESQAKTRASSETGLRYQQHAQGGSSVMLFARLRTDDRAFWFLGPATYVSHEGELPMAVTWQLEHPLPGDLFATFAAAVA